MFLLQRVTYAIAQNAPSEDWKSFTKEKYSVKYPESWSIDTSKAVGTTFIIFSPLESDSDKFQENVNMLSQDLKGQDIDLDTYVRISEKQITNQATDGKIYESTRLKTDKGEYHKIIFSATQGVYKLKFEQHYFVRDNKAYVITLTAEAEKFEGYKTVGEQILQTFTIIKRP